MALRLAGAALLSRRVSAETKPPARFLAEWGGHAKGEGRFDAPIGIALDPKHERLFVTDFKNTRVQRFRTDGVFVNAFAVPAQPGGIAVGPDGLVYVAHWSLHKIAVYSATGEPIREWGTMGTDPGQFRQPGGMAFAKDGSLYVADQGNSRVQRFSADGKFLAQWGELGSGPGRFGVGRAPGSRFAGPQFVAVDSRGDVYTTDTAGFEVQKFTAGGKPLLRWGSRDGKPGGFGGAPNAPPIEGPIALCVDHRDRVWVGAVNSRVQQFTAEGAYLGEIGGQGHDAGRFHIPHGMVVDRHGCLYVVDTENQRVQKFLIEV